MKIRHCFIAAGMLLSLVASAASAQTSCGSKDFQLVSDMTSQGLMVPGNSGYRGTIFAGNLAPGSWYINVNDTGWPTTTNSRRNYIRDTFYTYDAANHVFRGVFPMSLVTMQLANGVIQFNGQAQLTLEAPDTDLDGVFDTAEFNGSQTLNASVDAPCGETTIVCGGPGSATGSVSGSGPVSSPILGALTTAPCAVPVDANLWGDVKNLFRD